MNVLKLYSVFVLMALLTSCMGEGGHPVTMGFLPGVVQFEPERSIYLNGGTVITAPQLETMELKDGDCCLVDYKADRGDIVTDKIFEVDIIKYESVSKWPVASMMMDTTVMQRNERFVTFQPKQSAYVKGELFLFTDVTNHRPDQKETFYMSYDLGEDVELIDDRRVYELQLRSIGEADTTAKPTIASQTVPNAFTIKQFMEKAGAAEAAVGKDSLYFRINYPRSFNSDTTKYLWSTSDVFAFLINAGE